MRLIPALLSAMLAMPALAAPTHPLDGLSAEEYLAVREILSAAGHLPDSARFPLIELHEPDKAAVLAWKPGSPIPRTARALVKDGAETHEAIIDLTARSVTAWTAAPGEGMILFEEFVGAMELALSHPAMQAGLKTRGLTRDDVFCLPLTAGNFLTDAEQGARRMKVPCYLNPTGSNFYAKPVEGLFAVVDLGTSEVIEIVDTGALPLPRDAWGYTEAEIAERASLRAETRPATLAQPGGSNVTIAGGMVEWDMWRFHLRVDKRPGVVLSQVAAEDGGRWRSVLYQAHLSEVFVPYMDPDIGWYWRTYMDSGEYGFGLFLSPLRAGVDCPAYATFLPAMVHTDTGEPLEIPDAICIFERNLGDPMWRHFEIFAQTPDAPVPAEGRPWTELVVRSASEVGNYDYLMDYVFQQDGLIRVMVGATGLDAVKGAAATSMADPTAAAETRFGTLIAPNLVAPNHDHYFNYRLDFDVDGQANSFARVGLVAQTDPASPRQSIWVTEAVMPMTEGDAQYRVSPETPALYHVMNHGVTGALGHHPGYMIMAGGAAAYSPFDPSDPPFLRNAYIDKTFWVTPHDRTQRYAGGEYAMQSDGTDTLATWVGADRPVHDTDIVVWATMGFHHVPRMEDWPVMPTMWQGFSLKPHNFFPMNPAITARLPK